MKVLSEDPGIAFDGPATYQITVKGPLGDHLTSMLDNARIGVRVLEDAIFSRITLEVKDQAQLAGILYQLYTNHNVILKIESSDPRKDNEKYQDDGFAV